MTTLDGLDEKQILVDFVCGYFSKPAGGNRSNRLDSNPMQSSLSRCTSLTCVCLRLILKFDMFDVNQIATGNLAAASELLEMFQLSRGQGIAWNVETRELFDKPKIDQFFYKSQRGGLFIHIGSFFADF